MLLLNTFYNNVIHWLEVHYLPCPFKSIFHIDCPGCGMQRSFVELLKGNFIASIEYHPATIPLITFLFFATVHVFRRFKHGNKIIVAGYIFVSLILLSNYIYKIIYQKLV